MPTTDEYIEEIRGKIQQGEMPEIDPKSLPADVSFSKIQSAITKDYQDQILAEKAQGHDVSYDPATLPVFVNQEALDVTLGKIPTGFSASKTTQSHEAAYSEPPNFLPSAEQAKTALHVAGRALSALPASVAGVVAAVAGRPQEEVVGAVEQRKMPSQVIADIAAAKAQESGQPVGLLGGVMLGLAGEALDVISPLSLIPIPLAKGVVAGAEFLARKEVPVLGKLAEQALRPIEVEVPKLLGSKMAGAITRPGEIKVGLGKVPAQVPPPELPLVPPATAVDTPKPGFGKTEGAATVVETDTVQPRRVTESPPEATTAPATPSTIAPEATPGAVGAVSPPPVTTGLPGAIKQAIPASTGETSAAAGLPRELQRAAPPPPTTRNPIPDLPTRLPTKDQRTLNALTKERTQLNSLLQVTRSPKLRESVAQRMKSVDYQIRRLDRANGGTSDPVPETLSQDQARPEFQEAQALLAPVKRLDNILLGKSEREPPNLKAELETLLNYVDERQVRPKGIIETTKGLYDYIRAQGSPNVVMSRDAALATIWRFSAHRDAAGAKFLGTLTTEFRTQVPFQEGSDEALQLGKLLDTYEQLPAEVAASLPKNIVTSFQWMRGKWKTLAELVNQEIPGALPLERRIKAYIFRLSRQEDIVQGWKDDATYLSLKKTLTPVEQNQAQRLKMALTAWSDRGVILYDVIPRSIHVPFLESRMSLDAPETIDGVKAFSVYAGLVRRKVFDEAVVREGLPLLRQVGDPQLRDYGRWYLRNYMGLERHNRALQNLSRGLTGLEYLKDLGFNIGSAVNNATQSINTIAEIGPLWTPRGFVAHATGDPKWNRLWEQSQHFQDVDTMMNTYAGYWGNATKSFRDSAMFVFNQVELTNRRTAFFGAYQQGIAEGRKLPEIAALLRRGASSEEAALLYADGIVSKTQFVYGRLGTPHAMTSPGGRLLFQFGTFPLKQTELFVQWAKQNPKKLLSYLLWSGGTKYAGRSLGVDLSNSLGVGVDFGDLVRAARDLSRGEPATAKLRAELALTQIATGSGTGILPQGIFPVYATAKAVWDRGAGQLLGVQPIRLINAAIALNEGQVTLPVAGPEGGPPLVMKQGYPVRDFGTGRLSRVLTAKELALRTFIAQPVDPGKERVLRQEVMDRHVKALQREVAIAIMDKDAVKRDRLVGELRALGQPVSAGLVKSEAMKRLLPTFTLQALQNKGMLPSEQRMIESGGP